MEEGVDSPHPVAALSQLSSAAAKLPSLAAARRLPTSHPTLSIKMLQPPSPVNISPLAIHSGILSKRNEQGVISERLAFVVPLHLLFYFDRGTEQLDGVINLGPYDSVTLQGERAFSITSSFGAREFFFETPKAPQRHIWSRAMICERHADLVERNKVSAIIQAAGETRIEESIQETIRLKQELYSIRSSIDTTNRRAEDIVRRCGLPASATLDDVASLVGKLKQDLIYHKRAHAKSVKSHEVELEEYKSAAAESLNESATALALAESHRDRYRSESEMMRVERDLCQASADKLMSRKKEIAGQKRLLVREVIACRARNEILLRQNEELMRSQHGPPLPPTNNMQDSSPAASTLIPELSEQLAHAMSFDEEDSRSAHRSSLPDASDVSFASSRASLSPSSLRSELSTPTAHASVPSVKHNRRIYYGNEAMKNLVEKL